MKLTVILLLMVAMAYGALHAYQKRNALIQAALLAEGFDLSLSVKSRVGDYFIQHDSMPGNNAEAGLPPPKSIYGTSVKRVAVNRNGIVIVDFDEEIGRQAMIFTPQVSDVSAQIHWQCTSGSIDPLILELLKPGCSLAQLPAEEQLLNAIANKDLQAVEQLLVQGASVNTSVRGNSPLLMAAETGHIGIIDVLLKANATIDGATADPMSRTPAMVAILANNADAAALLLARGASIEQRDKKGLSAQDYAITMDRQNGGRRFEYLVTAATQPLPPMNLANMGGNKRSAAERDAHVQNVFLELSQAAADCHVQRLSTLLHEAGELQTPQLVEGKNLTSLIRKPACSEALTRFVKASRIYRKGLHVRFGEVSQSCDVKAAEALLHDHPDLILMQTKGQKTHMDRMLVGGCSNLISFFGREYLLNDALPDDILISAMRKAPQDALIKLVGALIEAGANVNGSDERGQTTLGAAISLEQPVVAKYLVDAGANISAPTVNSSYPIIEASKKGYNHLVAQLLDMGVDINQADSMGRTALIVAAAHGRQRLVNSLLRSGANPLIKDANGVDAMELAESKQYRQIHSLLVASAPEGS